MSSGMPLAPGAILARRYRLIRALSEGGMGRVWVAEHVGLAREVAVKVLTDEAPLTPVTRDLFQREARATARVECPHVVRVLDFDFTDDGFPFLVLERLVGETLAERVLRAGALSPSDTARLVDRAREEVGFVIAQRAVTTY